MLARRKALQRILKILMQKEEKYVLKAKGEVEKKRVSKMAGLDDILPFTKPSLVIKCLKCLVWVTSFETQKGFTPKL